MKYEINREIPNEAKLTITVEKNEVAKAIAQAYINLSKQVSIPGFRKGKAPRFVLEQHIGPQAALDDAAEAMMPPAYAEAISTEGLDPVDRPHIDIKQIAADQDFIFEARVTLRPEPTLGEYKDFKLVQLEIVTTDQNVEDELKRIQQRRATIEPTDEPIQDLDSLMIDFKGYIDGEAFDGGEGQNYQLTIGSGTFIPGFEEQLVGHKVGDDVEVIVTFPADYHAEEFQNKEAKFDVHINEARRQKLQPLDDTFAKDVSAFETLEELRADTRKRLEESAAQESQDRLRDQAIQKLLEVTEVQIPAIMIEDKIDGFIEEMDSRLQQQGLDIEKYLQYTGKTKAELREENRAEAERSVKTELALMEVAKREQIEADPADLDAEIAKVALMTNSTPEDIRERLIQNGQFEVLVYTMIIRKVIDYLVSVSQILTGEDALAELGDQPGLIDVEEAAEAPAEDAKESSESAE